MSFESNLDPDGELEFRCPRCDTKIINCDCPECAKHRTNAPIPVDLDKDHLETAPLGTKYIYFLWRDNHIKIGSTAYDPRIRTRHIQNESKGKVSLIGALIASESLELELHERFCRARVKGEWFYPCRELRDLLITSFGHL